MSNGKSRNTELYTLFACGDHHTLRLYAYLFARYRSRKMTDIVVFIKIILKTDYELSFRKQKSALYLSGYIYWTRVWYLKFSRSFHHLVLLQPIPLCCTILFKMMAVFSISSVTMIFSIILGSLFFTARSETVSIGSPTFPSFYQNIPDKLLYVMGSSANGNIAPLCGMESVHSDFYNDRQFKLGTCAILSSDHKSVSRVTTLLSTPEDVLWTRECPTSQVLVAVASQHYIETEDREFRFSCMQFDGTTKANCHWSQYVNEFGKPVNYRCAPSFVLDGVRSVHSNDIEDRRFAFRCCMLVSV